jgi:hypothetical protein
MLKEILYKWFGLEESGCQTCEVLRAQLDESNRERRELLHKLLTKDQTEPPQKVNEEDFVPIKPQYVPWNVRRQMLEAEDKKQAQLIRERNAELEKELKIE